MYRQATEKVVQRKDGPNAWNRWKRAGQGLSALETSACYKREKLDLCESEVPQEFANAGTGWRSAATPVGGGSHDDVAQRVIPRSRSGAPLGCWHPVTRETEGHLPLLRRSIAVRWQVGSLYPDVGCCNENGLRRLKTHKSTFVADAHMIKRHCAVRGNNLPGERETV